MVDILEKARSEGLALTFDDVLLVPDFSEVVPGDVDLKSSLTRDIGLGIPLVSADMDTVTGAEMARAMALQGGLGFLWKSDLESQIKAVAEVKNTLSKKIEKPVSVGFGETKSDVLDILKKFGNRFSSLVVVDENKKVVGLVTEDRTQFADVNSLVRDFMVRDPVISRKDISVLDAYGLMKERRVPKLILTDEDGRLAGMYCFGDVREIVEGDRKMYNVDSKGRLRVGANVGVNDLARAERLLEKGCDVLLVGTAHGHSKNVIESVREIVKLKDRFEFGLVAGNVATYEGAKVLFEAGADAVKVGIGPGSICTTRVVSGVGVPQISAVYDCVRAAKEFGGFVIADGGIRYSGDIVKALAAGASVVMMGSAFAGTEEAPGDLLDVGGQKFKSYRGMGSLGAMKDNACSVERYSQNTSCSRSFGVSEDGVSGAGLKKEKLVAEGVEGMVPYKGPVGDVIFQFIGGIRSGMGYVGARDIKSLAGSRFYRVTNAGQVEGKPHDVAMVKEALNYK